MGTRVLSPPGDLTDSYRDASVQSSSSASPLRTRHGRGDTPLSVRPASSLSSTSSVRRAALPGLDRLIAFLDGDGDDDALAPSTSTPSRAPSTRSPPAAPPHTHSRSILPNAALLGEPDDSTRETQSDQSPSARTERSRRERSISLGVHEDTDPLSGVKGKGVAATRRDDERAPEDSPSPMPGSVAELRERTLRLSASALPLPASPFQTEPSDPASRPQSPADSVSRIADEVRSLSLSAPARTTHA